MHCQYNMYIFIKMEYNLHTLSNGLRIIHRPTKSKVAYCGFAINAGTRDELPHEHGMAHFVEHLLFKETKSRKAWHILNRMEIVGGDLNAYTNKEETVVYSAFLTQHFSRAADVLVDIVFHSIFPEDEFKKEAEVIIDEIHSYEDNPSELIFDDFEDMIFRDHPLGHNILGHPVLLKSFKREDVLAFTSRYYQPGNMIFFVQGDFRFEKIVSVIEKLVQDIPNVATENKRTPPSIQAPDGVIVRKGTNQTHMIIGGQTYSAHDEKRTALYLLNNILGGPGMNSRLNMELRERKGLVYSIESNVTSYTDTGLFSIYYGTDPSNLKQCLNLITKELDKIRSKRFTDIQLKNAKAQFIGQIGVASDNNENNALSMAKTFLHYNKYETSEAVFERIENVSSDLLWEVANEILNMDKLSTLIYK